MSSDPRTASGERTSQVSGARRREKRPRCNKGGGKEGNEKEGGERSSGGKRTGFVDITQSKRLDRSSEG